MKPKALVVAAVLGFGGLVVSSGAAYAQGCTPDTKKDAGEATTVSASVVDMSCYLAQGLHGADHKMCSQVCAKAGVPLVFLSSDGQIILPVSNAMPSTGFNDELVKHAEENVKVTGKLVKKAGSQAIVVEKIQSAT
ncbi:MAG: hypothetical protein ACE5HP_09220 [Gemmatimonadota bacterium]